jgi:AcrR family transcriptional regulator
MPQISRLSRPLPLSDMFSCQVRNPIRNHRRPPTTVHYHGCHISNLVCLSRSKLAPTIYLVMAVSRPVPVDIRTFPTRERLLKAAKALFFIKGFTSVTVEDICLATDVSKGGFYHHFRDKATIFLAIALEELARETDLLVTDGAEEGFRQDLSLKSLFQNPVAEAFQPQPDRSGQARKPGLPVAQHPLKAGPSADEFMPSPSGREAEHLQPISSQSRSLVEHDASALLVDLWAWASRRPQALRRVRAVHRRAIRQLLRRSVGGHRTSPARSDPEAQAELAFLVGIGSAVRHAVTREATSSEDEYKKAAAG